MKEKILDFFKNLFYSFDKIGDFIVKMCKLSFYTLIGSIFFTGLWYLFADSSPLNSEKQKQISYVQNLYVNRLDLKYFGSKNALVDSIDTYINEIAPNSSMNGLTFVEECEENDVDLFFVLAQCQIESKFATRGLGCKTNSAFNIKAYDGKGSTYMDKYKHPDMSIKPYLEIIKETYLVHDTTEMDLMDNYINQNGNRYASDENYEKKLRTVYEKLNTRFETTYNEFKKYKLLSGN